MHRIVCGDSRFVSVESAELLLEASLRLIEVVKTAAREYPMKYLSKIELVVSREHVGTTSKKSNDGAKSMAVMWMDRERPYLISTASTTVAGSSVSRQKWHHMEKGKEVELQRLMVPQPQVVESYYKTCGATDRHNRCRRESLRLEIKFQVKEWSMHVKTSLLATCIVEAWMVFKGWK